MQIERFDVSGDSITWLSRDPFFKYFETSSSSSRSVSISLSLVCDLYPRNCSLYTKTSVGKVRRKTSWRNALSLNHRSRFNCRVDYVNRRQTTQRGHEPQKITSGSRLSLPCNPVSPRFLFIFARRRPTTPKKKRGRKRDPSRCPDTSRGL